MSGDGLLAGQAPGEILAQAWSSLMSYDIVPFLEASSWSPFTTIVASVSGSPGENPSFDLGRSGRRRRTCRFPLGGDALEVWSFVRPRWLGWLCGFIVGQACARPRGR